MQSLHDFKKLIDPNTEMVALLESYQTSHHYPDFIRAYNNSGIRKLLAYFENNKKYITNFFSVIDIYEIKSSHIFNSVKILFKNEEKTQVNIHFENNSLEHYLYNKKYPIVKIKKILSHHYQDNNIPDDFDSNEYKMVYPDLLGFDDDVAKQHFIDYGIHEGRFYKKNQIANMPFFLNNYLKLFGFIIKKE